MKPRNFHDRKERRRRVAQGNRNEEGLRPKDIRFRTKALTRKGSAA